MILVDIEPFDIHHSMAALIQLYKRFDFLNLL